ncbi:hypothetical protein ACMFMG_009223 [Clarireedia jacksonii]
MVAKDMLRSLKAIKFALMVGVGGGAPLVKNLNGNFEGAADEKDIRLGNVVISQPFESSGGVAVIQYDFGKSLQGRKFHTTGTLNKLPEFLLKAISMLQAKNVRKTIRELSVYLEKMASANPGLASTFVYQGFNKDRLLKESVVHPEGKKNCKACCGTNDFDIVMKRLRSDSSPVVHYRTIGSADQVMKHSILRNKWAKERNIVRFEMEAAGLMDNCLLLLQRHISRAAQPCASLIKYALPAFRKNAQQFASNLEILWTVIRSIMGDPEHPRIIFLLDALDECEPDFQPPSIMQPKQCEKMQVPGKNAATTFQLIITSRPYWDIESECQVLIKDMPNIRLPAEDNSEALRLEKSTVLSKLGSMNQRDQT